MTADPCRDCDLCARSAAMWEAAKTAPDRPWNEAEQQRIDQAAHQHDPDRERVFTRRPRLRRSA